MTEELTERYRLLTNCASLLDLPEPWTLCAVATRIAKHRKLVTPLTSDGQWELLQRSESWLQGLVNASRSSKRAARRKKWARSYSQGIRKRAAAHRRKLQQKAPTPKPVDLTPRLVHGKSS